MIKPDSLLDAAKLGNKMILTGISPAYAYVNNQRTDDVIGYKYEVAVVALGYDKLSVRIDGAKRIDIKAGQIVYVAFEDLQLRTYVMNGRTVALSARATGIHPVNA